MRTPTLRSSLCFIASCTALYDYSNYIRGALIKHKKYFFGLTLRSNVKLAKAIDSTCNHKAGDSIYTRQNVLLTNETANMSANKY